jgi:hypothetical protein
MTQTLGEVGVITDTVPPTISRLTVRELPHRWVNASFRVEDNFAGVEYQELKMYIDGGLIIPEIDGEHRKVTYAGATQLDRGPHLLVIHLKDKLGNFREVRKPFNIQ